MNALYILVYDTCTAGSLITLLIEIDSMVKTLSQGWLL